MATIRRVVDCSVATATTEGFEVLSQQGNVRRRNPRRKKKAKDRLELEIRLPYMHQHSPGGATQYEFHEQSILVYATRRPCLCIKICIHTL